MEHPAKNGVQNNPQDMTNGGRKNKFLYRASSQKTDPWSTDQNDDDKFGDIIKPSQTTNGKKRNSSSPGVDLDDVWSIRKNVQVTTAIKNGTALKTNSKSFYSRHGGLSGSVDTNASVMAKKQRIEAEETGQGGSGWSVPRPGYSYSDKFSYSDTGSSQNRSSKFAREFGDIIADDSNRRNEDEDFESKKNRLNTRLPMPGAPQIASREMSARTKRAHNLHQAHLKSSGLGQYSSSSVPYTKQLDDSDNTNLNWRSRNDLN